MFEEGRMERLWSDPRDNREWSIEAVYVMPVQEDGQPIAMMGPNVPLRIRFRTDEEDHVLVARLDEPLESLPDLAIEALLDAAREGTS